MPNPPQDTQVVRVYCGEATGDVIVVDALGRHWRKLPSCATPPVTGEVRATTDFWTIKE